MKRACAVVAGFSPSAELSGRAANGTGRWSPLTPDGTQSLRWEPDPGSRTFFSISFQFSERLRPPLFRPFYSACSSVSARHSPPKQANSFPRQLCCFNIYESRFFTRRKQPRASWPFSPMQGTGVPRPQPEPPPLPAQLGTEPRCPHHFCQDTRFPPPFCSSAVVPAAERRERKQNESTRGASVAAASLSTAVGGQGLGSGRKGGRGGCVETGWRVVLAGPPGAARSAIAPPPLGKASACENIPAPKGKFGLGLELKFETDWDGAEGTQGPRSVARERALAPGD